MSRSSTRLVIQIALIIVGYYLLPLTEALDAPWCGCGCSRGWPCSRWSRGG